MKKLWMMILISLWISGCSQNPSLNSGRSNTKISGKAVMYSQRTF